MASRGPALILESVDGVALEALMSSVQEGARLRAIVLSTAQQFEGRIQEAASRLGIEVPSPTTLSGPIVAAGHQPVVYHAGLVEKEVQAHLLADLRHGLAINFILDLDDQDCAAFSEPHITPSAPTVKIHRFGSGAGLPVGQRIETIPVLDEDAGAPAHHAMTIYRRFVGEPVSIAHVVARRLLGPRLLQEQPVWQVPFSLLVRRPDVQRLLRDLAARTDLSQIYNATLSAFRLERKIKNAANPFPNLPENELPFWVWSPSAVAASRRALTVNEQLHEHEYLVPRGALVSLFLRAWCCDVFIHGTGGRTYEPAVDAVATALSISVSAPYVIASANRYPFAQHIDEYEQLLATTALIRSGPSHVEELITALSFDEQSSAQLRALSHRKSILIEELQAAKSTRGSDTKAIGVAIKSTDNDIRSLIDSHPAVLTVKGRCSALQQIEETLYRRDFPFWYA